MCSKMCTQKAFRSNPLSMASCDLSFTFPQQRKKKNQNSSKDLWWDSAVSKRRSSKLHNPGEMKLFQALPHPHNHRLQQGAAKFPWNEPEGTSSYTAARQMCCSLPLPRYPASALCPAGGLESLSSDGIFKLPFTMCYQGYRPFARNRASKGLFMPIWFLLSYIRGQDRDRARFLSSKSILYGTQFSKVQPASAFMKHCAVKNEGSCFSPFKDVW